MSSVALARPSPASTSLSSRFNPPSTPSQQSVVPGSGAGSSAPVSGAVPTSTPASALASAPAVASTPQPGTWRHPSLDEIARRQNASIFNGDNVNSIAISGAALLGSVYVPGLAYNYTPATVLSLLNSFEPYTQYTLLLFRLLLLLNIVRACSPLFRARDEIEDIPLTPSQRALLGLKPSSASLTPGQQYITPPRYARSSTPRSGFTSASPLSARAGSPSSLDRSSLGQSKAASGSPYSASPLMQKALGGASAARRLSYGSSPLDAVSLGASASGGSGFPAASTTGLASGKASVGLNSKWLYERGRASPNGKALFT